jgi:hypothetical protein
MKTKAISEVSEAIKKDEYNKIVGITAYTKPKSMWMQMACKFYRKNSKHQGVAGVNWEALNKGHKSQVKVECKADFDRIYHSIHKGE